MMVSGPPSPRPRRVPTRSLLLAVLALVVAGCSGKRSPTGVVGGSQYQLEVRWLGDPPAQAIQEAFTRARNRMRGIITGGLSPVSTPAGFNIEQCDANLTGFPDIPQQTIQGLIIYVRVQAIDGPQGVLGNAGPCLVRSGDRYKPALGIMRLDEADLGALIGTSRLDALVQHEMLHVIGFGTVWTENALLSGNNTVDARFIGPLARDACVDVHGGTTICAADVPVHSEGGAGSAYAHWRESTFGAELMTPFLQAGATPLSAMTIRSLADIGYEVSVTSADSYALAGNVMALHDDAAPAVPVLLGEPIRPRFAVSPMGTLVDLRPPRH